MTDYGKFCKRSVPLNRSAYLLKIRGGVHVETGFLSLWPQLIIEHSPHRSPRPPISVMRGHFMFETSQHVLGDSIRVPSNLTATTYEIASWAVNTLHMRHETRTNNILIGDAPLSQNSPRTLLSICLPLTKDILGEDVIGELVGRYSTLALCFTNSRAQKTLSRPALFRALQG